MLTLPCARCHGAYGNNYYELTVEHCIMNDSIGLYLNDIGKVALLTAEDERELSKAIEAGRDAAAKLEAGERGAALRRDLRNAATAKDRFIRSNLRLVVSIARRYPLPQGMDLLDLIQEGNLGLEHAVDKFDWRRGFKFSTYATFWIRQAIGRALDQKASLIRIPGDRSASLRAALRQASGDGETLDAGNAELHRLTTPVSLDKTVGDDLPQRLVGGALSLSGLYDLEPIRQTPFLQGDLRLTPSASIASTNSSAVWNRCAGSGASDFIISSGFSAASCWAATSRWAMRARRGSRRSNAIKRRAIVVLSPPPLAPNGP